MSVDNWFLGLVQEIGIHTDFVNISAEIFDSAGCMSWGLKWNWGVAHVVI